jgi:hypothetical protein
MIYAILAIIFCCLLGALIVGVFTFESFGYFFEKIKEYLNKRNPPRL